MKNKGQLKAPGFPEVRQSRYPCLRHGFHSIASIKTGMDQEE